jgi:hypothetical protein
MREVLNAIFYLLRSGGRGAYCRENFPPGRRGTTTSDGGAMPGCGSKSTPSDCGVTIMGVELLTEAQRNAGITSVVKRRSVVIS